MRVIVARVPRTRRTGDRDRGPVRERMAIATAEDHNCTYCLSAHTCTGAGVTTVGAGELPATRNPPTRTATLLSLAHTLPAAASARHSSKPPGPWASPAPRSPSS